MPRVFLVHSNAAEAEARAELLRAAGFEPEHSRLEGTQSLRALRDRPPDAIVIDLGRMPSLGRAVATALRQQKATRHVPLVFAAGDPEKIVRVREAFPDAHYAEWDGIAGALRAAIAAPPDNPVVPGTMSGYSGTPLPKKLGIKPGIVVLLLGAPAGFEEKLGAPPDGTRISRTARTADLILWFNQSRAELTRKLAPAAARMNPGGGLWIVWPKKASGLRSDLSQVVVRATGLAAGLVDYKICALDETWSGLLFTRRRAKAARTRQLL